MENLNSFFSPRSIAIVGASPKKGKLGNVLIENIKKGDYKGKLYFVNPKHAKSKKEYFSSLGDIKKVVDLVLIAIPAQFVNEAIENGTKAKPAIKNFVVISSGFKEAGEAGKKFEKDLEDLGKKYDLNILGPNCLGFTNPANKLNATFTDVYLKKGPIAVVSQSGALAVALLDWAQNKKIGFSKVISIGNKAILDEHKIIEFLSRDKETKAIALYLEDIKYGKDFLSTLSKVTPKKPVIILKAGKTTAGQKAVSSHTGSLAQDQDIVEAVFEKMNVIPADNIEEFQDLVYYFNSNPVTAKKDVIVITNAGGPGVMASDYIGKSGKIKLSKLSSNLKGEIMKYLPASASVENPVDLIGDASPERYQKTLEKIEKYYPNNTVLVILTPQNQTDPESVAQLLVKYKKNIPNLAACFMGGEKITRAKDILEKNKIPNFESPERVLSVIEKLVKYSSRRAVIARIRQLAETKQSRAISGNTELLRFARNDKLKNRKMLFWNEAEKMFKKYGIQLTKSIPFENFSELKNRKVPFPCTLKTDDPKISHRLENNAVILNIESRNQLRGAFEKMKKTTDAKHFLIQPMIEAGLELIIGMKRDPSFGPVVLCGMGGSFTEIFKDKIILIPPFDQNYIKKKLSELKIFPILNGFRGKRGYDLNEISKVIGVVAEISADLPEIKEIDINPLTIYNTEKEGKILDVKIFL